MSIFKDILTGADNNTVAIGRWMGIILIVVAIAIVMIEPVSVVYKTLTIEQWGVMLTQWQVFVPVILATAGGLIAGTAFTEPKKPDNGGQ